MNEEIGKLKQQLENEINKNNDLKNKIKKLDLSYKEILNQHVKLIEENKKLKNELSSIQKNKENNNKISNSEKLDELYKKIEELKDKLARYPIELLKGEKLISVIFSSLDENIKFSVISKNTEKINILVDKLYEAYPEYLESDNIFISNGKRVNLSKSLDENKIHNSDVIILKKNDFWNNLI